MWFAHEPDNCIASDLPKESSPMITLTENAVKADSRFISGSDNPPAAVVQAFSTA
jgi:hypothetical protein